MDDIQPKDGDLKALIRFAKNNPVNFAFNPSSDKKNHFFAAHKRQIPSKLGKAAKAEGESKKVAFGTFTVEGKMMTLACERLIPKLAKDVKFFLKTNKVPMNVQVLDEDGNAVDSAVEDLPPDEEDVAGAPEQTEEQQPEAVDLDALKQQLTALQPKLAAVEGPVGEKLRQAFKLAVGQLQKRDGGKTEAALAQIEAALAKLPAPKAPEAKTDDGARALMERLSGLSAQIKALDETKAAKLAEVFKKVVAAAKAGKLEAAASGADQIEAALAKLAAANSADKPALDEAAQKAIQIAKVLQGRAEGLQESDGQKDLLGQLGQALEIAGSGDADQAMAMLRTAQAKLKELEAAPPETADNAPQEDGPDDKEMAWYNAFNRLEADVNAALTKGLVRDVDGLRKAWDWATAEGGDGRYEEALASLGDVEALLANKLDPETSAFAQEIGDDVKPFADAGLKWRAARNTMNQELTKLKTAIKSECAGDPELQVVADHVDDLTMHIANLDIRLEDLLNQIVSTPESDKRTSLKQDAETMVKDYEAELDTPFFGAVDDENGFMKVSVAATARGALANIGRVLRGEAA